MLMLAMLAALHQDPNPGERFSIDEDLPVEHRSMMRRVFATNPLGPTYAPHYAAMYLDRRGTAYVSRTWILKNRIEAVGNASEANRFQLAEGWEMSGTPTRGGFTPPSKEGPSPRSETDDPDLESAKPPSPKPWEPPVDLNAGPFYRELFQPAPYAYSAFTGAAPIWVSPKKETEPENVFVYVSVWSKGDETCAADIGLAYLQRLKEWAFFVQRKDELMLIPYRLPMRQPGAKIQVLVQRVYTADIFGEERPMLYVLLGYIPRGQPLALFGVYVTPRTQGPWDGEHQVTARVFGVGQTKPGLTGSRVRDGFWERAAVAQFEWTNRAGAMRTGYWETDPDRFSTQQWPPGDGSVPPYPLQVITVKPLPNGVSKKLEIDLRAETERER